MSDRPRFLDGLLSRSRSRGVSVLDGWVHPGEIKSGRAQQILGSSWKCYTSDLGVTFRKEEEESCIRWELDINPNGFCLAEVNRDARVAANLPRVILPDVKSVAFGFHTTRGNTLIVKSSKGLVCDVWREDEQTLKAELYCVERGNRHGQTLSITIFPA